MTYSLITPKLKDELLSALLSVGSMSVKCNVREEAKQVDTTPDIVVAVYDQFEEMGLMKQTKYLGGTVQIHITAKAHDLYTHGGFVGQEELLKANIQKLSCELELLSKNLKPDLLEKANVIGNIASNILSVLTLFKS